MIFSKETLKLADLCWSDDGNHIRSTSVIIGNKYTDYDGNSYIVTEKTYEELLKYQEHAPKAYKVIRNGKSITLIGKKS